MFPGVFMFMHAILPHVRLKVLIDNSVPTIDVLDGHALQTLRASTLKPVASSVIVAGPCQGLMQPLWVEDLSTNHPRALSEGRRKKALRRFNLGLDYRILSGLAAIPRRQAGRLRLKISGSII
jgi:hypothetical protein